MPNTREVKDEVLDVDLDAPTDEEESEEDESVVPPPTEDDLIEPAPESSPEAPKEEPEEPKDDSEEEEPEAEPETPKEEPSQPKPVEGETPREKALRHELTKLRKEIRDSKNKELFEGVKAPASVDHIAKLKEKGYTEEEIKNMDEAIDIIASSKGYVKKEQTFQDMANTVITDFVEKNPEYRPENDPDDVRWNYFKTVLASDYIITGKTSKQLEKIFQKVNQDVIDEFGVSPLSQKREDDSKKIQAAQQKIKSVTHSGGTQATKTKKSLEVDPEVRGKFKGFDDEDFE